jgi:hypothetical protein
MPGKRKQVAAGLHSELSEYSSLLRTLHTNDTLDLTKHITLPPPTETRRNAKRARSDVDEGSSSVDEPKEEPPKQPKNRKRDTWTRWPLLVNDVYVPEWGLEDEIGVLVRLCQRNNPHPAFPDSEEPNPTPPDADEPPYFLPHLTQSASNFLSSILALIALHTPARPQSMQDRINPIGWQTVLEILGACGDSGTIDATYVFPYPLF